MNTPNLTPRPHVFHIREGRRTWFVIADRDHRLAGAVGETEADVRARWVDRFGEPAEGFVRVTGYCRSAEAVAQVTGWVLGSKPEGGGA